MSSSIHTHLFVKANIVRAAAFLLELHLEFIFILITLLIILFSKLNNCSQNSQNPKWGLPNINQLHHIIIGRFLKNELLKTVFFWALSNGGFAYLICLFLFLLWRPGAGRVVRQAAEFQHAGPHSHQRWWRAGSAHSRCPHETGPHGWDELGREHPAPGQEHRSTAE